MASTNLVKYVGDFETTTTPEDLRVWASCLVEVESVKTVHLGNDIQSMFDFLENKNSAVFFHNLKFDGEFILAYLLRNGYKHFQKKEGQRYVKPEPRSFETLIADNGTFYTITVYFAEKNKKWNKVTFYDSLKKLPFKVSVIAKAFELPLSKLTIDYDAPRPVGHVLTEEEKEYIEADCKIVAEALKIQLSKGLKRMTNASDAMNDFRERVGKDYFRKFFPVLPLDLDADIRRAYRGGFTYCNPKFQGKRIKGGITFDVNSLYPSRMYDCLLPYGYPMYFEGEPEPDEDFPLFIVRFECAFELKEGKIPCIQLKNNSAFIRTEYLTTSRGEITQLTLTNVDLALFLENYETSCLHYECGWKFKGMEGIFKEYIEYWMHIKETTTGALRQLAKLMLNSLYGKFATNPRAKQNLPFMDLDGVVEYSESAEELREPIYTAMACFITAYARDKTIRSAQAVFDRFIYADTDSLHLAGTDVPEILEVHPTRLGAWKFEGEFVDSVFLRAKTYMETMKRAKKDTLEGYAKLLNKSFDIFRESDGIHYLETVVTCAGMPDNVKELVTYENFKRGAVFDGKLVPRRFPGGVVLMPTTFSIN